MGVLRKPRSTTHGAGLMGALSAGLAKVREATHGDEEVGRLGPFVGWALPDSLLLCLTASASEEEDEEGDEWK